MNTTSDSEVLLNVFAHELAQRVDGKLVPAAILDAVGAVHRRCSGGYAAVAMIIGAGIVAFRDQNGIRPVVLGKRETLPVRSAWWRQKVSHWDALGFELERDLAPGEAVFIDLDGEVHQRRYGDSKKHTPCIFEYVYFARPDSIIDKISVYKARLRMGERLADKILRLRPEHDIDVVVPIPILHGPAHCR